MAQILSQLTLLHRKSLSLSLFREFLDSEEPFAFEDGLPLSSSPGKSCELTLEHVSFRYPGAQEDTLHDIRLTIRPGEKLAAVGCNGAGKTTLIKLLCGFYDPTQGKVLLNGEDIRPCNRRDYYQHFSLVSQNFSAMAALLLFQTLSPYVTIYFTARLLNEITEACRREVLFSLTGYVLLSTAVLTPTDGF